MLGNHMPRQCGIATFTTDLTDAIAAEFPAIDCLVLAMNDPGHQHAYPERVRFEIAESEVASYRRAADFLNVNTVDAVCVQHEYGIFGGKSGSHVLTLLRELRMPIVTTLHTIVSEPSPAQRRVMDELTSLSERVVVMSEYGEAAMRDIHRVPASKIDLIPTASASRRARGGARIGSGFRESGSSSRSASSRRTRGSSTSSTRFPRSSLAIRRPSTSCSGRRTRG